MDTISTYLSGLKILRDISFVSPVINIEALQLSCGITVTDFPTTVKSP